MANTLPNGYRQGLITAITVFLAFGLAFLRFWAFETTGPWDWLSGIAALLLIAGNLLFLGALFRAIDPEDDDRDRYIKTTGVFKLGAIVTMLGLIASGIAAEYYQQRHPELRRQSAVSFPSAPRRPY